MTAKDDKADAKEAEGPAPQTVENENGEVHDVACVNAYVVGVSLLGPGDPQTASAKSSKG